MESNHNNNIWAGWPKSTQESVAANMKVLNDFEEAHGTPNPYLEFGQMILEGKITLNELEPWAAREDSAKWKICPRDGQKFEQTWHFCPICNIPINDIVPAMYKF